VVGGKEGNRQTQVAVHPSLFSIFSVSYSGLQAERYLIMPATAKIWAL
jgi:hypothetical protein